MFPSSLKPASGIWCALLLCAVGQNAVPNTGDRLQPGMEERLRKLSESANSGDRLEAENAARLVEFAKNNNRGGPPRPISPELNAVDSTVVKNLKAEDLAKMSLDDPVLKAAYVEIFLRSWRFKQLEPPQELALADMRRRGEAVSPMLLKLISENQENRIENAILLNIEHLDTVRIEPFLEYARKLLRERTQTMTGGAAGAASFILGQHGTREDEALLEWVIKERPYVASDLTKALKNLRTRLDPSPAPRPERREIPSSDSGRDARSKEGAENHPQAGNSATFQTKPWLIGGIILVVLLGVYRFLRKSQRGQP